MVEPGSLKDHTRDRDVIYAELERLLGTRPFQQSHRCQKLLRFIVMNTLDGHTERLKERNLGIELFGREPSYDTNSDAIVRVSASDLRKRLAAAYQDGVRPGHIRITVSPGVYTAGFEPVPPQGMAVLPGNTRAPVRNWWKVAFLATLAVAVTGTASTVALLRNGSAAAMPARAEIPWPLSAVLNDDYRTVIVLADANAGIQAVLRGRAFSLQEYLSPGALETDVSTAGRMRRSLLTSYPDASIALQIAKLAGRHLDRLEVRSARDMKMRDLREGHLILLGSPMSNPWVSLFAPRLNFEEAGLPPAPRWIRNKQPQPGEQLEYRSFAWSGTPGTEYATVALLPLDTGKGNALILQGLHQEGTDAAGSLVSSAAGCKLLRNSLGLGPNPERAHFEALIQANTAGGVAATPRVIATRALY